MYKIILALCIVGLIVFKPTIKQRFMEYKVQHTLLAFFLHHKDENFEQIKQDYETINQQFKSKELEHFNLLVKIQTRLNSDSNKNLNPLLEEINKKLPIGNFYTVSINQTQACKTKSNINFGKQYLTYHIQDTYSVQNKCISLRYFEKILLTTKYLDVTIDTKKYFNLSTIEINYRTKKLFTKYIIPNIFTTNKNLVYTKTIDITNNLKEYEKTFMKYFYFTLSVLLLLFIIKIFRDATLTYRDEDVKLKYKKLYELFDTQITQNNQLNDFNKKFIADTVHQIKTPLSVIISNTNLIEMFYNKDEEVKQYMYDMNGAIQTMVNNCDNMSSFVSNGLPISSIINISDICEKNCILYNQITSRYNRNLKWNIEKGLRVFMNEVELHYIINNNLSNALKYSNLDSTIYVTLKIENEKIRLTFRSEGSTINDKDKIFTPFYTEHPSSRNLGLGLAIVKSLCEKNNIKIELTSENNKNIFSYFFNVT